MPKKWNDVDMITALDTYLDGGGIAEASKVLGRSRKSIANIIRSDLPRNYRNCVKWMECAAAHGRRKDKEWSIREDQYLSKLVRKHRTIHQIMIILGRTALQIDTRTRSFQPKQPGEGFGFTKGRT
jgi:hypothetical protein